MQKSKLIRLLSTFTKEEMGRFRQLVHSPFFNTNVQLIQLADYLYQTDLQSVASLSYPVVYQQVFNQPALEEPVSKTSITKLASKLYRLAEQFIMHQTLTEQDFDGAFYRKQWFRSRRLSTWEADALHDMQVSHARSTVNDQKKAMQQFFIEFERAKWVSSSNLVNEHFDLRQLNYALDLFYLRLKLECLCHQSNHELVSGVQYEQPEWDAVKGLLSAHNEHLPGDVALWEHALTLLKSPVSRHAFETVKSMLESQIERLGYTDKQAIYLYLTHTARHVFPQPAAYFSELMLLYESQISNNCLLVDGFLDPNTFFNIISVAIRLKKPFWAEQFYADFVTVLEPGNEKSPNMKLICQCLLQFESGRYETALQILNQTIFRDIQGKLTERRMRLKIYLELGYSDTFFDQINAFRKFLSVNKAVIPPHHETGNKAFLQAALLIYKLKHEDHKWQEDLRLHVGKNSILPEMHWIEKYL